MSDLTICPACSKEVSRVAEKCPHCGHPIKPKKSSGCLVAVGVALIVIGLFWWPGFLLAILVFIWAAVDKE